MHSIDGARQPNHDRSLFGGIRRQLAREQNASTTPDKWPLAFVALLERTLATSISSIKDQWHYPEYREEALSRAVAICRHEVIPFFPLFNTGNTEVVIKLFSELIDSAAEKTLSLFATASISDLYIRREVHRLLLTANSALYLENKALWTSEVPEIRTEILLKLSKIAPEEIIAQIQTFDVPLETDRARIFQICLEKKYWETLEAVDNFRLKSSSLNACLGTGILQDPWRLSSILPTLAADDPLAGRLLALACAESDPQRWLKDFEKWKALDPSSLEELLIVAGRKEPYLISDFTASSSLSSTMRRDILCDVAGHSPFIVLDNFDKGNLDDAHRASVEEAVVTAAIDLDPLRLARNFHRLKFPPDRTNELLFLKAAVKEPESALVLVRELSITSTQTRFLAALRCAAKAPKFIAENVEQLELDTAQREKLFLTVAAHNPLVALGNAQRFGIDPDGITTRRQNIIQRCLRTDPFGLTPLVDALNLDEPLRQELANACLHSSPAKLCGVVKNLRISDAAFRLKLAMECVSRCPWQLLANLEGFELQSLSVEARLVRQFGRRNPWKFLSLMSAIFSHQEALAELAAKCVELSPQRAIKEFPWNKITQKEKRVALLKSCLADKFKRLLPNLALIAPLDEELESYVVERGLASDPWRLLSSLSLLKISKASNITAVAETCARRSVAKLINIARTSPLSTYAGRIAMLEGSLRGDPDTTSKNTEAFALGENEQDLFSLIGLASRYPKRALSKAKRSPLNESQAESLFLLALAHKNPSVAVEALQYVGGQTKEVTKELAIEIGSRKEELLFSSGILHELPDEADRFDVALKATVLDRSRLIGLVERLGIAQSQFLERAAMISVAADVQMALKSPTVFAMFSSHDFRVAAFRTSVLLGEIDNALMITRESLSAKHQPVTNSSALGEFDRLLNNLDTSELNSNERETVSIVRRIRAANCGPTNALFSVFAQFDDDSDKFITQVLTRAGNTFGVAVVTQLKQIFKGKSSLPADARAVVDLFLRSGYRGFDRNSFKAVFSAYSASPHAARQLLGHWLSLSSAILRGATVQDTLLTDPKFPALVNAAYRPIGMSVSSVAEHLNAIVDHSQHLEPYQYPSEGYQLLMAEQSEPRIRQGESIDLDGLAEFSEKLKVGAQRQVGEQEFQHFLVRAGQCAVSEIDLSTLIAFLRTSTDRRLAGMLGDIVRQHSATITSKSSFSFTSSGLELFNVLEEVLEQETARQFDERAFTLSAKVMATIKRAVRKGDGEQLSMAELKQFICHQFGKLFEADKVLLRREIAKFEGGISGRDRGIRAYLTKSKPSFFARAGAGLCSALDYWSWNNAAFLQINLVDEEQERVVGNIQLHIFKDDRGRKAVLARPNPTESFLRQVNSEKLAAEVVATVWKFANDNKLKPYLPDQHGGSHLLTNRSAFAPHIKKYFGRIASIDLKLTHSLKANTMYEMLKEKSAN